MQTATETNAPGKAFHIPVWLGLCLFLAIAAFLLLEEHRAHILGLLPYALLLLCPVIHIFMHRGHGNHGEAHSGHDGHPGSGRNRGEVS